MRRNRQPNFDYFTKRDELTTDVRDSAGLSETDAVQGSASSTDGIRLPSARPPTADSSNSTNGDSEGERATADGADSLQSAPKPKCHTKAVAYSGAGYSPVPSAPSLAFYPEERLLRDTERRIALIGRSWEPGQGQRQRETQIYNVH